MPLLAVSSSSILSYPTTTWRHKSKKSSGRITLWIWTPQGRIRQSTIWATHFSSKSVRDLKICSNSLKAGIKPLSPEIHISDLSVSMIAEKTSEIIKIETFNTQCSPMQCKTQPVRPSKHLYASLLDFWPTCALFVELYDPDELIFYEG